MLRESMGGEGVQGSDAKSFQQLKAAASSNDTSGAASSSSSLTANSLAYASMHYDTSSSNGNTSSLDAVQTQHFGGQLIPGANMGPVTCLVCYNAQVDVLLEPCGHQFHLHCIDRWLNKDKVCPICWNPIQSQRRLLVQAHYANSQQHQAQSSHPTTPSMGRASGSASTSADSSGAAAAVVTTEPVNPAATRKGKWTAEESLYCDRLIEEFKKGNLPLAEGTTLRTFLAKLLNCDPMRISKKYTGDQCIGKVCVVYCTVVSCTVLCTKTCRRLAVPDHLSASGGRGLEGRHGAHPTRPRRA